MFYPKNEKMKNIQLNEYLVLDTETGKEEVVFEATEGQAKRLASQAMNCHVSKLKVIAKQVIANWREML